MTLVWWCDTVDGSEMRRSAVDVVQYSLGFIHPKGGFLARISEPSTGMSRFATICHLYCFFSTSPSHPSGAS